MHKQIPIYGRAGVVAYAIVSPEDYARISQHRWNRNSHGYVQRKGRPSEGETTMVGMHRQVMGFPEGLLVDHRNHDLLDNTRENLRVCTGSQNQGNRRPNRNSVSRFIGVDWHRVMGKWRAQITINHKRTHLGVYDDEEEAARAYDVAARAYFGEFARPNFAQERNREGDHVQAQEQTDPHREQDVRAAPGHEDQRLPAQLRLHRGASLPG